MVISLSISNTRDLEYLVFDFDCELDLELDKTYVLGGTNLKGEKRLRELKKRDIEERERER